MNVKSVPSTTARRGFTLTEIVLCVAIISTVLVSVVGILPVGLDVSRKAVNHTVVATAKRMTVWRAIASLRARLIRFENSRALVLRDAAAVGECIAGMEMPDKTATTEITASISTMV